MGWVDYLINGTDEGKYVMIEVRLDVFWVWFGYDAKWAGYAK
jgi:hypothetical protein